MMLNFLIKQTRENLFLPYYHTVSNEDLPHIKHLYPVKKIAQFEHEIDFLLQHFQPLSLQDLYALQLEKKQPAKPSFFLSFDDGFSQCYDVIAPILLKKGIPATFFINSAFVDNQEMMYRNKLSLLINYGLLTQADLHDFSFDKQDQINDIAKENNISFEDFLQKQTPYMSLAQLKKLEQQGFTIGAHSHSHPYYQTISLEEQLSQTRNSLDFVAKHFKQAIQTFAFPFDDIGVAPTFFKQMQPEIDLFFTTGGIKHDEYLNVFRRVDMEYQNHLPAFLQKQYAKFLLKKTLGIKHIHKR